jgi:hypothetical protein
VNVPISDPSLYKSYLGRGDWRLGATDTFTVRYSLNDRVDENVTSNTQFGSLFAANQDILDTNIAVSNTHVFAANLLNEARFSLVRRDLAFPENDPTSPTATISGLFTIGGATNFPQGRISNAYQFSNTLTWTRGRHTMKFGGDVRYNDVDNQAAFNSKGAFTFNNLQAYMNNDADRHAGAPDLELGGAAVADVLVRAGRLPRHARPDAEPRPALRAVAGAARDVRRDRS